ncbi:MAG TPA: YraN family protein [Abditibacteriaceae bacterium]|jgi:putative endonuclease
MSEKSRPVSLRRQRGQEGEALSAAFLQERGWEILERNWRPGNELRGEIDLIACDGRVLCFVEVKTRASSSHGAPQEAVTRAKQKQISALANAYLSIHKLDETPCRFDVIEVFLTSGAPRLVLHTNAFDYLPPGSGRRAGQIF